MLKPAVKLLVVLLLAGCSGHPSRRPEVAPIAQFGALPVVIHNPYSLGVDIELKCDSTVTRWHVPGKGKAVVWIPAGASGCELWPKIRFWR